MPMWRCPHCGTPQAETSRCWVCKRSSTSCGTCRHFRRSVAAQLGYCGLDRRRVPLIGDEIRACWEATSSVEVATDKPPVPTPSFLADREPRRPRDFVLVDAADAPPERSAGPAVAPVAPGTHVRPAPQVGLWADLD